MRWKADVDNKADRITKIFGKTRRIYNNQRTGRGIFHQFQNNPKWSGRHWIFNKRFTNQDWENTKTWNPSWISGEGRTGFHFVYEWHERIFQRWACGRDCNDADLNWQDNDRTVSRSDGSEQEYTGGRFKQCRSIIWILWNYIGKKVVLWINDQRRWRKNPKYGI